ncbi:LysO family transporter [Vallitalea pronyensis]|uniref:LysO family transporter n=1 Tax=Vallitalea pronyensis TaxID=1348613 RepID=A0A8J8MIU7_9FIRM|nr:LysO family transporter [Vallitalea pronyensis]QUI22043.1 LysO family transporter [Vallitalea pronyensis]
MGLRFLLYLGMLGIGIIIGFKGMSHKKILDRMDKLQLGALVILLFVMGIRIGADDKVIKQVGNLGLKAFIITFFAVAFSVLFVGLLRRFRKMNKRGERI